MSRQFWEPITFKAVATISTASQTTNHTSVTAVRYFKDFLLFAHVTTIAGTTHTLDIHLETKGPDGFWYDLPQGGTTPDFMKFPQISATGLKCLRVVGPLGKELRAVSVLGAASRGRWGIFGYGRHEE